MCIVYVFALLLFFAAAVVVVSCCCYFDSHISFTHLPQPSLPQVATDINCVTCTYAVELQWLEHFWDYGKLFETWVVRASEG